MDNLTVSYLQTALYWEDRSANREMLWKKMRQLPPCHVIVLPEMFDTGFTMEPHQIKEQTEKHTLSWMKGSAKELNAAICGSIAVKELGRYYNRFLWVEPDGKVITYDKKHLFRMGREPEHYSPGNSKVIITYKGWKILPLVCYDLRFPVWARNQRKNKVFTYDLLICIASWPASRSLVWKTLLQARALENQAYCVGVNRIGEDQNGLSYSGDSIVLDAKGQPVERSAPWLEHNGIAKLSIKELNDFREKFPVSLDWDPFLLKDH